MKIVCITVRSLRDIINAYYNAVFFNLLLQRKLPQMFALLMEPCEMVQVFVLHFVINL